MGLFEAAVAVIIVALLFTFHCFSPPQFVTTHTCHPSPQRSSPCRCERHSCRKPDYRYDAEFSLSEHYSAHIF